MAKNKAVNLVEYGVYPGFVDWFAGVGLPHGRKKPVKRGRRWPRVEVGGDSMRVGKTTALTVLEAELAKRDVPVMVSTEDWHNNPHLQHSYSDPAAGLLASQKWFAQRKYEQVRDLPREIMTIQDVNPEMDFCYALTNALMGRMSLRQFEEYVAFYDTLDWQSLERSDLFVYLKASDEVLVERAQKAAREFETVDPNYFLVMKAVNRRWLEEMKRSAVVLEVDTDDFDFSADKAAKGSLADMTVEALRQQGWRLSGRTRPPKKTVPLGLTEAVWKALLSQEVVVLCGLPGSGKSYWGRKLAKEMGAVVLSSDKLREKMFGTSRLDRVGDVPVSRQSDMVLGLLYEQAADLVQKGKRVVIDATNVRLGRTKGIAHLRQVTQKVMVLVIKTSDEVAAARMKRRRGQANENESYYQAWQRVRGYFAEHFASGTYTWPSEEVDNVPVVEGWNQ